MRAGLAASAAACSVILLSGCGTSTPPPPPQPSPTLPASPIPAVQNPRDVTAMAGRPCELLTPQQAGQFGLDLPPEQRPGLFDTFTCGWQHVTRDRETIRTVDVSMFTNNPTLEVAYYRARNRPFFELTEITGYPAIVSRTNAGLPYCDIDVKVAERQSISLTYYSKEFADNPQQACVVGKQVAAAMVANLPSRR
jgi:hypothetical protein